jgi:DNA topoisomerase-1
VSIKKGAQEGSSDPSDAKDDQPKKAGKAKPRAAKKKPAKAATGVVAAKAAEGKAAEGADEQPAKKKPAAKAAKESTARAAKGAGGTLVIVESPAKASTIKKYLGHGFEVKASVGHVKDLPKASIGIDIEHDFQPEYVVIDTKKKVIAEIKTAAKKAARVLLAPDPDREGEAIAWHIADEIRPCNDNIHRVLFNEITKKAVLEAIEHPLELDVKKYESQQARRVLDRLVGYQISPILWSKVRRGLSAGRVQSVAVRLLVEREEEIKVFQTEEYWTVEVDVEGQTPPPFVARVVKVDGEKPSLVHEGQAQEALGLIRNATLKVVSVERKERRKNAPAPFITSRLQQEASSKLRFSPKRTMALAQRLYEGIDLGAEGPTGLITYMRTDSTRISDDAVKEVRVQIASRFSPAHLPAEPNIFKSKKSAQDAHEAIRPTLIDHDPERVRALLTNAGAGRDERETEDLIKLYTLIWNRFVACQMAPAIFDQTAIEIEAGRVGLRANGQVMRFPGFLEVYAESMEDASSEEEGSGSLPDVKEGEVLLLVAERPEQHFTQPPPRFSEATLVRELEEKGIGRPSTYAAILSTIQDRGYAEKREGRLYPTELGTVVNGLLVKSFPDILNADFTAQMEEQLDEVEEGAVDWIKLLKGFYAPFERDLDRAKVEMRDLKREEQPTEEVCEKCGKPMVIKWGRNGYFLACTGYPECRNTKEYTRNADGTLTVLPATRPSDQICPTCSSPMVVRRGRFGEFLACSRYPECKTTSPVSLGVACPRPNCGGYLSEKRSRRGKVFFGCSNYSKSKCDFVSWDRPLPKPCPQCGAPFIVQKVLKSGTRLRCIAEGCGYTADPEDAEAQPNVKAS